ncbi:DUF1289 domain-containing protein [Sphingomonas sp.]|uniref:DUF1289 domain-containing protein n=1 Tax=Sphingomonas sp. TaxID=28214 RepID=UPI0039C8C39F
MTRVRPVPVTSPCILVCTLDLATGWCLGCGRTGGEIAGWTGLSQSGRATVLGQLPARMRQLLNEKST